jgi:Na+/proline symporter
MDTLLRSTGGAVFTGGLMLLGSLSAIMSTADSAIISCSNVCTIDLVKGWLWPMCNGGVEPNARQTMIVSQVASLVIVILGVGITNLGIDLSALFVLQGALMCQATPAFALGLYHPSIMDNSLIAGMFVGTTIFAILEFGSPELKAAVVIGPGFVGLVTNIFVTFCTDFALKAMGKKATPDADKLDHSEIMRIMENNVNEPIKNPVLPMAWILIWMMPTWVFPSEGVAPLLAGVPTWFIYQMIVHVTATILLNYVIWSWKPAPPTTRKVEAGEQAALKTGGVELEVQ